MSSTQVRMHKKRLWLKKKKGNDRKQNRNRPTMNPRMLLKADFKIAVFDLFRNLAPPEI